MTDAKGLRKLERVSTLSLSSAFGLGYMPFAPGTWGTLGAIPLWWLMRDLPVLTTVALTTAFAVASVFISARAEALYGRHDVGHIVIDEVAGLLVAVVGVPFALGEVLAACVVFRVLDIVKPQPIRWLDENVAGGLGVVLDDVVAGLVSCALLHGARFLLGGWW